jgi:hypothetical protein
MQLQPKFNWNDPNRYAGKESFIYDCNILQNGGVALAPGATANLAININGDSDFFWTAFACYPQVTSAGQTASSLNVPGVTLQIVNQTSGRYYMNNPIPAPSIIGTGQLPFILPQVTVFEAKATITIQVVNITNNTTYSHLYFDFIGVKAYLKNAN